MPPPKRPLLEALRFEVEELQAVVPDAAFPDEDTLRQAAIGGLDSEPGLAVVKQLKAAAKAGKMTLPAELGGSTKPP